MKKTGTVATADKEAGALAPPGHRPAGFWRTKTTEELAAEQGVKPVENIDDLRGGFWPEDESIDEFLEEVYRLRDEEAEEERAAGPGVSS